MLVRWQIPYPQAGKASLCSGSVPCGHQPCRALGKDRVGGGILTVPTSTLAPASTLLLL